jgi:hypothetical protein
VSIDEGFDFLGFAIKRVRGRHGRMVIHTLPQPSAPNFYFAKRDRERHARGSSDSSDDSGTTSRCSMCT